MHSHPTSLLTSSAIPAPATQPRPAVLAPAVSWRALVVDESPLVRSFLRRGLAELGASVTEAADGRGAWIALHTAGPFSLVVADLELRGLDGIGLLGRIRADSTYGSVRFVLMADSETAITAARVAGVEFTLAKPFAIAQLHSLLRSLG